MHRALAAFAVGVILFPCISSAAACPNLPRTLSFGSRGADVTSLQTFLIAQNDLAAGNTTGYFGALTEAAVKKFQCERGVICEGTRLTTGYGVVGSRTRAAIALACGGQTTNTNTQTTQTQTVQTAQTS